MKSRLFVVEDSDLLRARIVTDVLAFGGFELVGTAVREIEAVEAISRLCPAIVITDLRLAEGTGIEVVRQTQLSECRPLPRVFVLTNYADSVYKQRCMSFGAEQFFDKSSEYNEFLRMMAQISAGLDSHGLARH